MSNKQRIPKDITLSDLVAFAESIGCIVSVRLVDKQRPTPLAPDRAKRAAKSKPSASKRSKSGAAGKA